jgi:cell division protein FtsZ
MSEMGLAMMGTGTARGDDRAQAAAEAAIQNPLLDDVNLAGANGILVNITAGADFTMAEFDEVGRTVENFGSEDATIVIGTVLDPDMQDEVRVTVVATGLNRNAGRQVGRHEDRGFGHDIVRKPQVELVRSQARRDGTTGMVIEEDATAFGSGQSIASSLRGRSVASEPSAAPAPATADFGSDSYLDIPAFLRRQAD